MVQSGPHSTTRYWVTPNDKKLVEAEGSVKINDWTITFYANEFGQFRATAAKYLKKVDRRVLTDNSLEIKLETTATIPSFTPIEKTRYDHDWKKETFVELSDGKDLIVPEFNEFQGVEPYNRKYARSSIIKAYDFLKQYLPEFEDLVKDPILEKHTSKIISKAEKL